MTTMQDNIDRIADRIIEKELLVNVSSVVEALAGWPDTQDEIATIQARDDWKSPVLEGIEDLGLEKAEDRTTAFAVLDYLDIDEDSDIWGVISSCAHNTTTAHLSGVVQRLRREVGDNMRALDQDWMWPDLAALLGIDLPHEERALEHWAVTEWLADKLDDQGELVLAGFLGLHIWGRTNSGQSAALDSVIRQIAADIAASAQAA